MNVLLNLFKVNKKDTRMAPVEEDITDKIKQSNAFHATCLNTQENLSFFMFSGVIERGK